jgi:hypothetical protein
MLPRDVDSFDEFEILLRRTWEILQNRTELADRPVRLANPLPKHVNYGKVDPEVNRTNKASRVSVVPDPQGRP